MATVGGNLFAPPPAGDLAAALLALDAEVKLVSAAGERIVPLADFYTGFLTTVLKPGELLAEIIVPVPTGKTAFIKYGRKHSHTPAIVTVAAHLVMDGDVVRSARIALGAAGPHPIRARAAEAALQGSALNAATIEAAATAAAAESRSLHRRHRQRVVPAQDGEGVRCSGLTPTGRGGTLIMASKIVSFTLNGRETEVLVKPLMTLQRLLRDQLGYTATKTGCRQGGCGSCTVLVDGEPMTSCLLPVEDVTGKEVTTLEGITPATVCIPCRRLSTRTSPPSAATAPPA